MELKDKTNLRKFYESDYIEAYHELDIGDLNIKYKMIEEYLSGSKLENKIVVDIGCGIGGMLSKIKDHFKCIPIGSDLSFKALSHKPVKSFSRIQSDAQSLPLKTSKAELIYFIDLLEHLPCPAAFLKSLKALSSKVLMFIPMESAVINNIIYSYRRLLGKKTNLEIYGHIHRFNKGRIKKLLNEAGFRNFTFKTELYDDFSKHSSKPGKMISSISKLCYKFSPFLHRQLFGGHAFIVICHE